LQGVQENFPSVGGSFKANLQDQGLALSPKLFAHSRTYHPAPATAVGW